MHGAISRASPGMDILIMRAGNAQAISRLDPSMDTTFYGNWKCQASPVAINHLRLIDVPIQ